MCSPASSSTSPRPISCTGPWAGTESRSRSHRSSPRPTRRSAGWPPPSSGAGGEHSTASIRAAQREVEMRFPGILSRTVATVVVAAACQAPRATPETSPASPTGASVAASKAPDFTGKTLNIVTGGTGGVYIVYGAGLADMLTKRMKVAASAQTTPASVDNMKLIRDGKADLAFTLADTAYDAINGKGRFAPPEAKVNAQTIAVMYSNYMHLVAKTSAGINTVADLKGKRVSIGAAGSGTETKAIRILEAYGLNATTDIQPQRLAAQDSADALRDSKIDAFFFDGGLPTSAVTDIANSTPAKLIDQTDAIAKMNAKYANS